MAKGPLRYAGKGERVIDGREAVVNLASRFRAQQSDELRAVGDF